MVSQCQRGTVRNDFVGQNVIITLGIKGFRKSSDDRYFRLKTLKLLSSRLVRL